MTATISLIAQHSGCFIVVDLSNAGPQLAVPPGVPIAQDFFNQGDAAAGLLNGLFRMDHLGNGWYRIISQFSDMVFDVAEASQASGAPVILWPWHGGPNQRFRTKDALRLNNQTWGYSLEAQHSGKVLDVVSQPFISVRDRVVQWDYHGGPNQLFRVFGSPIKPMHSNFVLDVATGSHNNGAPIVQWPWHGGPNQQFRLEYINDPAAQAAGKSSFAYRVVANHSGKVWDVERASRENGARLIQWDWHGGPNQLFTLRRRNTSGFSFVAKHSGKSIDVMRASQDQGAQLIQWDYHGGPNQRFKL